MLAMIDVITKIIIIIIPPKGTKFSGIAEPLTVSLLAFDHSRIVPTSSMWSNIICAFQYVLNTTCFIDTAQSEATFSLLNIQSYCICIPLMKLIAFYPV